MLVRPNASAAERLWALRDLQGLVEPIDNANGEPAGGRSFLTIMMEAGQEGIFTSGSVGLTSGAHANSGWDVEEKETSREVGGGNTCQERLLLVVRPVSNLLLLPHRSPGSGRH